MRLTLAVAALLGLGCGSPPAAIDPKLIEMPEFRTVETAVTAKIDRAAVAPTIGQSGYLGVTLAADKGRLIVADVAADSPAERAGLKRADVILDFPDLEQFRAHLQAV